MWQQNFVLSSTCSIWKPLFWFISMNGNIKHYAGHVGRPKTKDSCNKPDSCLKNQNLNAMISYFKQNKPWSRTSAIVTLALDSKSPLESARRAGTEFGSWLPCNCRSTSVPSPLADFDAYPVVWVDLETQVPSQVKVSVGFLCTNGTLFQTKVICCFPSEQVDSDHIKLHATVWWNTITKILGGKLTLSCWTQLWRHFVTEKTYLYRE